MITVISILEDHLAAWKALPRLTTEEWFQKLLLARILRLSRRYADGVQVHDDYDAEGNSL